MAYVILAPPTKQKMSTKSDATDAVPDATASETSETSETSDIQAEQDRKSVIWQCAALIIEEHNDTYKK